MTRRLDSPPLITSIVFGLAVLFFLLSDKAAAQADGVDWKLNWGLAQGFSIEVDTEGYSFPSAIAFVPEPGAGAKDPLYFVTELRGKIKVVTNDRTVYTFAEGFFDTHPGVGFENLTNEYGMAGICLAPEQGYVFVTYTYFQGAFRYNAIARFETAPRTFSVEYSDLIYFTELFEDFPTDVSHQIGGCQAIGEDLFVGVGDSRYDYDIPIGLDIPLGKVLRMTLDGAPSPSNPFFQGSNKPADFIWAYGFRNPFGLKLVNARLFLAENGQLLDRFVEIFPGEDYLWDGTDYSIGARSIVTFSPNIGPAHIDFVPSDFSPFPSEYRNSFYIAMSRQVAPGIMQLPFDFNKNQVHSVPVPILTYNGSTEKFSEGVIAALALGPDGLYFAPILPSGRDTSSVYKIAYDPDNSHPYLPGQNSDPEAIIHNFGCLGCHSLDGAGGTYGPSLDYADLQVRLSDRLNSPDYLETLEEIDRLSDEPYLSFRDERQQLRELQGTARLKAWVLYHLLEPKFDNPDAIMPNLGLSRNQAEILATFLLQARMPIPDPDKENVPLADQGIPEGGGPFGFLYGVIPPARYRYVAVALIFGLAVGFLLGHRVPD